MLGTAEVVTEQGWGGVFMHVSVRGGVGESFYFGETTAVAFSHAGIPCSLHVCQVSPTWYSSE